jgi:hypothetical protein
VALILTGWGLLAAPLSAQEKYKVYYSYGVDPKTPEPTELGPKGSLSLRPNIAQPIAFFVQNLSGVAQTVVVKAVLDGEGSSQTLAQAEVAGLADKGRERLAFKKAAALAAPLPPPGKEKPAEQPKDPAAPLKGPPFHLQLWVQGDQDKQPEKKDVPVSVLVPTEYVGLGELLFKRGPNRFSAEVNLGARFAGPPCVVELVLPPAQIPGLVPTPTKNGVYRRALTALQPSAKLVADKLLFREEEEGAGVVNRTVDGYERAFILGRSFRDEKGNTEPPVREEGTGYVNLTVDGYERAFILETNFRGEEVTPKRARLSRLDVVARRYLPATARFRVGLEVDAVEAADPAAVTVEVALDRERDGSFAEKVTRSGPREQQVTVAPAEDGALTFTTVVRDWAVELNTDGLFGDYPVRAQLKVPRDDKKEEVTELRWEVSFDSSPPEILEFTVPPRAEEKAVRLRRGELLTLVAKGVDEESGIVEAAFFLGKVPPDRKLPPNVVITRPKPETKDDQPVRVTTFEARAELPAPTDKVGAIDVAVQFTNGAGVKSFGELKVILVDDANGGKKGDGAAAKPGNLKGRVLEGDRPQGGLIVTLRDAKGEVKATTKTDAKGNFAFNDLPPGPYRVSSEKPSSGVTGSSPAQVQPGEKDPKPVEINLLRR